MRADASGAGMDANDVRQAAVRYVHNLSKRTALYATYSAIKSSGSAAYVVGTPPAAAVGGSSKGYELGLRHFF